MIVSSRGLGAYTFMPTQPIITAGGGNVPSSPIMQTATTVSSQGALPPNIVAGGCSQLLPGFYVGPGNYIFSPDGRNTGDSIDVDGQRLASTGLPLCHGGSAYQDLGSATVLSIPDDVRMWLRNCGIASHALASLETQAQAACVQAQQQPYFQASSGETLAQLWATASGYVASGAQFQATADANYAAFKAADDAVGGAYSNGNYANANDGAFVRSALQEYLHISIAWPNVQAAAACVHDEFWDFAQTFADDFHNRYSMMEKQAGQVIDTSNGVQDLLKQIAADSASVAPQGLAAAVQAAQPSIKALNELAGQLAAIISEAAIWDGRVTNATASDPPDWQTLKAADDWVRSVQDPFPPAPDQAARLAADIHGKLDAIASQLHDYIVQHPELTAGASKPKVSGGKVLAGVGVVGVVALLIKKGLIFG